MTTLELAKSYIESKNYRIKECEGDHIIFKYRLNEIIFLAPDTDDSFFSMNLAIDVDDTQEQDLIKDRCYNMTQDSKMVKFYFWKGVVIVSAELFYLNSEDFVFQFNNALNYLLGCKLKYKEKYEDD